jgi:hypothetical protein
MTDPNEESQPATPSHLSRKQLASAANLAFDNDITCKELRRNSDLEKENALLKDEISKLLLSNASHKHTKAQPESAHTEEKT